MSSSLPEFHACPFLQPHPILAMAPPPERLWGLAGAMLAYATLALGGALLLRMQRPVPRPAPPHTQPWGLTELLTARAPEKETGRVQRPAAHEGSERRHDQSAILPPESLGPPEGLVTGDPLPHPSFVGHGSGSTPGMDSDSSGKGPSEQKETGTPNGLSKVLDLDGTPPRILHRVDPAYPLLARMVRMEGSVDLGILVDAAGRPVEIRALSGAEPFLSEAERAVWQWRFAPALAGESPVPARFRLSIRFRLRG